MDKSKWEYKLIKECGTVLGGSTPSTTNPDFWNGQHPWISPAELNGNRYIYDSVKKVTDLAVKAKSLKLLPINSIVLSSRAPIGKVAINKVPLYFNQGFKNIICGPKINSVFLYWWLWGKNDFLNSLGTGATFKEISKKVVENITIPVPPLAEQQEIVGYLDKAFAKIDALKKNAEQQLSDAKALFSAALEEAMTPKKGWESQILDKVCFKITDGTHNSPVNTDCGDYMYITAKNIKTYGLDLKDITFVSKQVHNVIFARCNPEKGDVLYIKDGATTGIAIVNPLDNEFSLLSSVALLKPNKELVSGEYLCYMMNSPQFYNYVRSKMEGAAITRVTLTKIKKFSLAYPSLPEQQTIVAHLDALSSKVNQLQDNYNKILRECDALKQALLREIFE